MALIERVTTLLRANINDLLDRAENPEITLKQIVVDMENQLLQVKTQVAIALADQHLSEKRALEQEQLAADWHRKAKLAVTKGDDPLARAALQRALSHETNAKAYRAQIAEGAAEGESLRASYAQLQAKLAETEAECERLIAQHRRARMLTNIAEARIAQNAGVPSRHAAPMQTQDQIQDRIQNRIHNRLQSAEATRHTREVSLPAENLEHRFADLEKSDRVEQLLNDLKSKQQHLLPSA